MLLEEAVDVGVVVMVTVLVGHHGDVIVIMPVPIPRSTPPKKSRVTWVEVHAAILSRGGM